MTARSVGNHFRGASCEAADPRVKPEDDDGGGVCGGDGAERGQASYDSGVKTEPNHHRCPGRDPGPNSLAGAPVPVARHMDPGFRRGSAGGFWSVGAVAQAGEQEDDEQRGGGKGKERCGQR